MSVRPVASGADASAVDKLRGAARLRAASWRADGDLGDLNVAIHPPAQSARLGPDLLDALHQPPDLPAVEGPVARRRKELSARLTPELDARLSHLERYVQLLTTEVTDTIAHLHVELAELHARVGRLEMQSGDAGAGQPAGPER